ncbi:MAG: hypothetical protein Q9195_001624 [Heterodermia aff. obscurata]
MDPLTSNLLDRSASSASNNEEHGLSEAHTAEAKRVANLKARIATLESQIEETRLKKKETAEKLNNPDAQATVSKHIKLLHQYNEIRDIGQGLMGLIADQRGVRIVDVYEEFGVAQGD